MSYIGRGLQSGAFRQLDDISSGFDGSDTPHTMQVNSTNVTVGDVNQILLSLGGVIQKPGTDFTVSSSTLTFTTAPAANTSFFAILLGSDNGGTVTPTDKSVTVGKIDINGGELFLDADDDTSITADTDDQIDIKIGGTDALRITGTALTGNALATIGATGTASSLAGIPFYNGDGNNSSIYTHDVSGTDSTAQYNTAYGLTAMDAITTGDNNVALGWGAGTALTTGSNNLAIGVTALQVEDTGSQNVAIGTSALSALNYDGDANNICIGHEAGESITTGRWNHFIGTQAGDDFDTEHSNLGIGYRALGGSIAGGEYNVAVGNSSGINLTSGDSNVAVGYYAASNLTTGTQNVAIGQNAMAAGTTTGASNICVGAESGNDLTSGANNVFIGHQAGFESTTGSSNVGVGVYAAYNIVGDGGYNVCAGYAAGYHITTGDNNICLGRDSGRSNAPSGAITTADNVLSLGNDNIGAFYCATSTINTSDKRDKADITNFTAGLSFIEQMQPVTYKWDKRSWYSDDLSATPDGSKKAIETNVGFIAQDVETLEKEIGFANDKNDMLFVDITKDGKRYGMKYERLVTVLVNAVKELSAKVKELESK